MGVAEPSAINTDTGVAPQELHLALRELRDLVSAYLVRIETNNVAFGYPKRRMDPRTNRGRLVVALSLRFGLDGGDPLTLDQIGSVLNVSREGARRIVSHGLDVLHAAEFMSNARKLQDEIASQRQRLVI